LLGESVQCAPGPSVIVSSAANARLRAGSQIRFLNFDHASVKHQREMTGASTNEDCEMNFGGGLSGA
jgi:hypothetical protein